jgi:hypothetical protein
LWIAVALGEVFLQRAVVEWLATRALEPSHIIGVLHALQEFFVVLNGG